MKYALISGPASDVVTLEQVKAHCRIVGSDQDDYLNSLIVVSRQYAEHYCQKSLWRTDLATDGCHVSLPIAKTTLGQHRLGEVLLG